MTQSIIERVAEALFPIGTDDDLGDWSEMGESIKDRYRGYARAAIEAMRFNEDGTDCPEPIRIAGEEAYSENGDSRAIFNAILDAALNEESAK
ncbi:hypothetical protein [Chelativorans xinjiangense]|uniref:hypothetical protein n=1 Tax=Chelativorans xinjiangense TaxID=2681485 RepID=UPI001357305C|nr:hypothetical protein [Chelativorans xinjiangense]